MQLSEAIDKGQVAVAVEATSVLGSHSDKVAMIDITQCGCGITIDSIGVDENLVATCRHVTASKHGITDGDTAYIQLGPLSFISIFIFQQVQIFIGYILASLEGLLSAGLYGHTSS